MNLKEIKKMLEENDFNLWGVTDSTQNNAADEVEKDNFTEEEFDKACEDLGLEDSGEESDDVDDFFSRLQCRSIQE